MPVFSNGTAEKFPGIIAGAAGGVAGTVVGVGTNFLIPGAGLIVGGLAGVASGSTVYSIVDDFITGLFSDDVGLSSELRFSYFDGNPVIVDGSNVYLNISSEINMNAMLYPVFADNLTTEEMEEIKEGKELTVCIRFKGETLPFTILASQEESYTINKDGDVFEYILTSSLEDVSNYNFYIFSSSPVETEVIILYGLNGSADNEVLKANLIFEDTEI